MSLRQPISKCSATALKGAILIQWCLLTFFALAAVIGPTLSAKSEHLVYPACAVFACICAWMFWSWQHLTKSLFDPYSLFLMSAFLFNGGQVFLEVLGLNERGILQGVFGPETVLKTVYAVGLGLTALHLGALLALSCAKRKPRGSDADFAGSRLSSRVVGWGLLAVSIVPSAIYLKSCMTTVMSSGYMALWQDDSATGAAAIPRTLSMFIIPGALYLLSGSKGMRRNRVIASVICLLYGVLNLLMGNRGDATMFMVAFAWLWHRSIRALPSRSLLLAGAVLLFVVLPFIGSTRRLSGDQRLSARYLMEAYLSKGNLAVTIISEMGSSMRTVAYTLELVPEERKFDRGAGYANALLTMIPGASWPIQESYDEWLTWRVMPTFAEAGGGVGFSFVAESYVNFGWFGIPIVLGALGFAIVKAWLWAERSGDPAKMAAIATVLTFLLIYPRASAGWQFRRLFCCGVLPYAATVAVRARLQYKTNRRRINLPEDELGTR